MITTYTETAKPAFISLRQRLRALTRAISLWAKKNYQLQRESPAPLAMMRIALGGAMLFQAGSIYPHLYALFGRLGIMQPEATMLVARPEMPRIHWFTDWAAATLGWNETLGLAVFFWTYAGVMALYAAGGLTRVAAPAAWLLHLMLKTTGATNIYGVSEFANILLFYSIFMPVGARWSVDSLWGRRQASRTLGAALARRVLRWHLCLVYISSGIGKAQGEQWHTGEAIWRATFRSENPFTIDFLAQVPWFAAVLCWGTLFLEAGYILMFWRKARGWFLASIIMLHTSIAICLGLWVFAAVMIAFNLGAWAGTGARPWLPECLLKRFPLLRKVASSHA